MSDSDCVEEEDDFVTDEEWDAVRAHLAEQDAQKRERASLVERKQRMKENRKQKGAAAVKGSGYRISKRPLHEVHREVLEALHAVRAEKDAMRVQWDSLTGGKPHAWKSGRRVRFRL